MKFIIWGGPFDLAQTATTIGVGGPSADDLTAWCRLLLTVFFAILYFYAWLFFETRIATQLAALVEEIDGRSAGRVRIADDLPLFLARRRLERMQSFCEKFYEGLTAVGLVIAFWECRELLSATDAFPQLINKAAAEVTWKPVMLLASGLLVYGWICREVSGFAAWRAAGTSSSPPYS